MGACRGSLGEHPHTRVEVSTLRHRGSALRGPTPLLRLQGDERLVALTRRGHQAAYEVLVARYQSRLLAFCRHMLSSREDAEDVLQEVFAAAFNAMLSDERSINVRPWLYRIARNRCLNHLRRQQPIGVDSMDVHFADHGTTTADRVHKREEFRELVEDVQELPETQRTALLLREIDALSYEQIAEAMETTVPSIKSLLVRARVSLAEAAEARRMTCEEVREELGEVAEGLTRRSPPVRRHLRQCDRCAGFDKQLRQTNRALAAMFPLGPLLLLKKFLVTHAATSSAAGAAGGAAAVGTGGALGAGATAVATKAAAGIAAAAIVTAGAVEVDHARKQKTARNAQVVAVAAAPAVAPAPRVVAKLPQPSTHHPAVATPIEQPAEPRKAKDVAVEPPPTTLAAATPPPVTPTEATADGATSPLIAPPQTDSDTTALPAATTPAPTTTSPTTTSTTTTTTASSAPAAPAPTTTPAPAEDPAEDPAAAPPPASEAPPATEAEPQPTASPSEESGDGSSSSTTPSDV